MFKWNSSTTPVGTSIPWSINDTCRLIHLFLETDLQSSISRLYQGLDREEMDNKVLRKSPWMRIHHKFMDKNWEPIPPESWMMDEVGGGGDFSTLDPSQQPNKRSVSDLGLRWRWIRKMCTQLWNNWDKSGRHSEEDLHPWSFCGGEILLLYAFRLFDGSPSESYIRRTLPKEVQMDSGSTGKRKRKSSDGKPPTKKKSKNITVECIIPETETDLSIQRMSDSIRLSMFMNVKNNDTFESLNDSDKSKVKNTIKTLINTLCPTE